MAGKTKTGADVLKVYQAAPALAANWQADTVWSVSSLLSGVSRVKK